LTQNTIRGAYLSTPPSPYRHPQAISPLEAMATGTRFEPVLASTLEGSDCGDGASRPAVDKLVICSGKVRRRWSLRSLRVSCGDLASGG
jgi:2-oxoglutarate dehydrogenase complex dehydrogenase (E1) component-like enzyme